MLRHLPKDNVRKSLLHTNILMASTRWGHHKDYRQRKMSLHGKPIYYAAPPKLMISVFTFLERPEARSFSAIYHVFTFLLICASLIVTVFVTIEEHREESQRIMFILEIILVVVFSVELIARVWSAGCRLRYQGFKGRLRFLRKPFCIIDMIVVVSSLIIIILGNQETTFAATAMRGLRFLQVLRMVRVDRRGGTWKLLGSVVSAHSKELITAWYIGFLALIFSSFLVYQVEKEVNKEEFGTFADALWWGLITLTTIGYGDKTPHTWAGRLIASCFAILGISFFALPAGILGSGFALKVQEQHRQKHFARRQTPAAVLIQCFWRCYAADADSISTATWQPYLRGYVAGNNSQGKKTLKNMFKGAAHGNKMRVWGRMDNDLIQATGLESNIKDDFMKGTFGRLQRLSSTNRKSTEKKDSLDAELENSDDDSSTRSFETSSEFSEPQKIAIRLIRLMKYQVARREFKEALRPYDVKDVIEQYSTGHDDMLARVKSLQSRVDCIIGIKSSATSPSLDFTRSNSVFRRGISVLGNNKSQVNPYEKEISMNERLMSVESSVTAIDRKLDQLIASLNNNRRIDDHRKSNRHPSPDCKLSDEEDSKEDVPTDCESLSKKNRFVGFSRDLRSPRLKRRGNDAEFSNTKFFSTESCKDIDLPFFTDEARCEPPICDQIIDIQEEYDTIGQKTPLLESCEDCSDTSPSPTAMQTLDIRKNTDPRQTVQFSDINRNIESSIC